MTQHTVGAEHQTPGNQTSHPYSQCAVRGCSRVTAMRHFQAVRNRIGDDYTRSQITNTLYMWQTQLANAMIDRIIHNR